MKTWLGKLFGRGANQQLDCHAVGELLQHYLDGEIDAERGALIHAHLEDCRRCGLEAETYEQIKHTLATRRADVPEDSVERLREFGLGLIRGEEPSTS
jgi:predicted anti-sigma-YlaC factor YlaD